MLSRIKISYCVFALIMVTAVTFGFLNGGLRYLVVVAIAAIVVVSIILALRKCAGPPAKDDDEDDWMARSV